jgi:hypothetical protein
MYDTACPHSTESTFSQYYSIYRRSIFLHIMLSQVPPPQSYIKTYYIYIKTVTCNNFIISISPFFSGQHVSASHGHPQVLLRENFHTAYVVIKFKAHITV